MAHGGGRQRHQRERRPGWRDAWRNPRPVASASTAPAPKIRVGTQSGRASSASKAPPRRAPSVSAAARPADQRQGRRADQQGGRRAPARPSAVEAEGDAQQRRQDGQRQAGHNPVSRALGQRRELERPGRQQQQVERAVLVVGGEQAIERQQRGEQRGAPQDARGDARQQVGLRPDAEREQHRRHDEEGEHDGDIARPPPDQPQVAREEGGEAGHRACETPSARAPACRDRHGSRRWRGRRRRDAAAGPRERPPAPAHRARSAARRAATAARAVSTTRAKRHAAALAGRQGAHGPHAPERQRSKATSATSRRSSAGGAPRSRSATRRFSRTVRSPLRPSRWPSQASRPRQVSGSARTSAPCQRIGPGVGRHQQGERAQQRGLAAAVAAGERQQLAGGQGEGQAVEDRPAAAAAGKIRSRRGEAAPCGAVVACARTKKKAVFSGESEKTA